LPLLTELESVDVQGRDHAQQQLAEPSFTRLQRTYSPRSHGEGTEDAQRIRDLLPPCLSVPTSVPPW
jgi:hypothetical protein